MKKEKNEVKPVKFSNKQSKKAFEELPDGPRKVFSGELDDVIAHGIHPTIPHDSLPGKVMELKVNGRPAYRCVYKVLDDLVIILHSFKKTTQGPDRKNLKTVETRLASLDSTQFC